MNRSKIIFYFILIIVASFLIGLAAEHKFHVIDKISKKTSYLATNIHAKAELEETLPPGRYKFGVPHVPRAKRERIAYSTTYRLMQSLSSPWVINMEPAEFSTPDTPSPFTDKTDWKQIAGPHLTNGWPDVRSFDIKALASFQGKIYAGIRAGWSYNRDDIALVYAWADGKWNHVGGDGVFGSWEAGDKSRIQNLKVFGEYLYAGIGGRRHGEAELWRFDGKAWEIIGGNGLGWNKGDHGVAYSIIEYQGNIIVGCHSYTRDKPPAIYRLKGKTWERIAGDGEFGSWPAFQENGERNYYVPYEFAVYKGELYLGLTDNDPHPDVWRFNGSRWQMIGGGGINGSWDASGRPSERHYLVTDLLVFQGKLLAALSMTADDTFVPEKPYHPLWAFDGEMWKPVGNILPEQFKYNRNSNNVGSWRGRLYLGIQNPWIGASLWEFGDGKYSPVLGYGKYASWGPEKPPGGIWTFPWHGYVYHIITHDRALIVALGSEVVGGAQIWRYAPQ